MAAQARSTAASIASRVSASSAADGDSSTSFWWRRWIEHSRSPSVSTPPARVAEHLDLDVPGRARRASRRTRRRRRTRPRPRRSRRRMRLRARPRTRRGAFPCPRRPPTALSRTGKPAATARSAQLVEPRGAVGARERAGHRPRASPPSHCTLSPIRSTTSAGRPDEDDVVSSHARTNSAFSARKP